MFNFIFCHCSYNCSQSEDEEKLAPLCTDLETKVNHLLNFRFFQYVQSSWVLVFILEMLSQKTGIGMGLRDVGHMKCVGALIIYLFIYLPTKD